jgi:two-component system, sensor histidine kinase and response regulator
MAASFTTKQFWALSVIALACLIVVGTSFFVFYKMVESQASARHAREVLDESRKALLSLLDCENAYRGFLLTADPSFLTPYSLNSEQVFECVNKIKKLTADNPSDQKKIPRLLQLAKEKASFTQTTIDWRQTNPGAFNAEIPLRQGKLITDEFRQKIEEIVGTESQTWQQKRAEADSFRIAMLATLGISGTIIMTCLIWIGLSSRRYVREQAEIGAALQNARDEAVQANRLKTQFVANISHEIRTPLSGILGLSELLTNYNLQSDASELVGHIYTSAQSLVTLVNEILDFSRLEAGRLELSVTSFQLQAVVEQVVASCMVEADGKKVALKTTIEDDIKEVEVCGDFNRVRQVLLNIVFNAIKFTNQGEVLVTISKERVDGQLMFVRFQVADTGIGIDETQKRKLFEPFVQADGSTTRKYGGTGLGLSISLSLVHLMRGNIDCFKNEKGGATFWFTVPFEFGPDTTCSRQKEETPE